MTDDPNSEGADTCAFCDHEQRAGGSATPCSVRVSAEEKEYLTLCPVARTKLARLGLIVKELSDGENTNINA